MPRAARYRADLAGHVLAAAVTAADTGGVWCWSWELAGGSGADGVTGWAVATVLSDPRTSVETAPATTRRDFFRGGLCEW
ncbi:hypothetical protein [Jatrophihabitans lederbergiae]|uniref:Uncharacterized protein n=1 Tax=Jatrophihabitans lederbergiae TaxID=3075547 RepID=A0ABU2J6R5_9ACTN|nr:hypothetical protein [Jatrophihabitans sp. DSM 44399]MDT0259943.1 hypothetical protein [Jatrophihabitans sp. DSM 44399]